MDRKFKRIMVVTSLLVAFAAIVGMRVGSSVGPESSSPSALPVKTERIKKEDGYFARRSFTGRVVAGRASSMAFELGGTLKTVHVDTGSLIQIGQPVATLDTGRLLAGRDQLLAQKNETASNLKLAERTFERVREIYKQGHVSAQRLDEAEANAVSLRAALERQDASIAALDVDLAKAHMIAPFTGVVTMRYLDEGSVVGAGTPIIELTETSRIEAHVGMPPHYALTLGTETAFELRGQNRKIIPGVTIRSVVPVIEGQTRTMMVTFDLPPAAAQRGELVNVVVQNWQPAEGAWLPLRALSADVRGLWRVYKVINRPDGNHVAFENVQILYAASDKAYVTGTISDDDTIIVDGLERLAPGQLVTVISAAQAR